MDKVVHIISHTHWDREWYMPYEKHHVRLVALMDALLQTLETNEDFRSFHLDGQTIILEDYLQVRPDNRQRLSRLIAEGRIIIGPWYILQDEFLTSCEANVRNLFIGHQDARAYGPVAKVGYFPDSFGNIGQAPQLLRQAGITNAVFGRGVKPTGFNNAVADSEAYESPFSEMIWRAPDGSEVTGILFANWYHNGMEIPVDEEAARDYWPQRLANVERFASTKELLFMNGCDHQPVQVDLAAAVNTARKLYPDIEFRIGSFEEYIGAVEKSLTQSLTVVTGELRSQRTDGWGTLVNTASARVYIKQANARGQILLERIAEPAAAFAAELGRSYPRPLLTYAWKTLMQNHPHDSICGCSVDEVHAEMMTRFAKSRQVAESLAENSQRDIAAVIATSGLSAVADAPVETITPFVIMNYAGQARTGRVVAELEIIRRELDYERASEIYAELEAIDIAGGSIIDESGQHIQAEITDLGVCFNYALPDDRFRQPYMARRVAVTLIAEAVPGLGYRTYAWRRNPERLHEALEPTVATATLGNEYYSLEIQANGSLILTDTASGNVYRDLCVYENVGDIGNEYVFKQDGAGETLTTRDLKADIHVLSQSADGAVVEIVHRWEIPAEADTALQQEMATLTHVAARAARRSAAVVPLVIRTQVTIERGNRALKLKASFNNQAKNHRLRALFPSEANTAAHIADSIFELAERSNLPAPEWHNPSNAQHQQAFVALDDSAGRGLAIANIGLNEYEVLRDGRNTIAVTLLRAVGELGDWGVFPTPEAQCLGDQEAEFAIIAYSGSSQRSQAAAEAYAYQIPWTAVQTDLHPGKLPMRHSWLQWSGERLALSAVKGGEEDGDFVVRWFNPSHEPTVLALNPGGITAQWWFSNIMEERLHELQPEADGMLRVAIRPHEIVTLLRACAE